MLIVWDFRPLTQRAAIYGSELEAPLTSERLSIAGLRTCRRTRCDSGRRDCYQLTICARRRLADHPYLLRSAMLSLLRFLRGKELVGVRSIICLLFTAALSLKECEHASNVIKGLREC